jgi:hypothetical protein
MHASSEMCSRNIVMINAVPNAIFWDVTLCSHVNVACYLREVCCGYLQGRRISAAWKMLYGYRKGEVWGQSPDAGRGEQRNGLKPIKDILWKKAGCSSETSVNT